MNGVHNGFQKISIKTLGENKIFISKHLANCSTLLILIGSLKFKILGANQNRGFTVDFKDKPAETLISKSIKQKHLHKIQI